MQNLNSPTSPTPAGPNDGTLNLVRQNVRNVLTRSAAFRALAPDKQREVARDTVKVARFITDAGGETAGTPFGAIITNPAAEQMAMARPLAPAKPPKAPDTEQTEFTGAQEGFTTPAADGAAGNLENLVNAVDFPSFVGGLIEGVFNAIVQTSIQQMEAYSAMVANVSKSVDQYMHDNVSEAQAQDQLVSAEPGLFNQEWDGDIPKVAQRDDANADQMGGFLQGLGLPFDLDTSEPEVIQQEVVPAMRKSMAMDRQKLLATMVLMGINRIVVTDGKIQASVMFDISTKDIMTRNHEIETSFENKYNTRHNKKKKNGWWIFSTSKESERTRLNVTTNTDTTQTDESESKTTLKAKLTGNVDLRFKSDYFPLEKMMDMLGTNETVITQTAQQGTPAQQPQGQPMAPLPPPPMPPMPGAGG